MNINAVTAELFQATAPVQPAMPAARTGEREMAPAAQPPAETTSNRNR